MFEIAGGIVLAVIALALLPVAFALAIWLGGPVLIIIGLACFYHGAIGAGILAGVVGTIWAKVAWEEF